MSLLLSASTLNIASFLVDHHISKTLRLIRDGVHKVYILIFNQYSQLWYSGFCVNFSSIKKKDENNKKWKYRATDIALPLFFVDAWD